MPLLFERGPRIPCRRVRHVVYREAQAQRPGRREDCRQARLPRDLPVANVTTRLTAVSTLAAFHSFAGARCNAALLLLWRFAKRSLPPSGQRPLHRPVPPFRRPVRCAAHATGGRTGPGSLCHSLGMLRRVPIRSAGSRGARLTCRSAASVARRWRRAGADICTGGGAAAEKEEERDEDDELGGHSGINGPGAWMR